MRVSLLLVSVFMLLLLQLHGAGAVQRLARRHSDKALVPHDKDGTALVQVAPSAANTVGVCGELTFETGSFEFVVGVQLSVEVAVAEEKAALSLSGMVAGTISFPGAMLLGDVGIPSVAFKFSATLKATVNSLPVPEDTDASRWASIKEALGALLPAGFVNARRASRLAAQVEKFAALRQKFLNEHRPAGTPTTEPVDATVDIWTITYNSVQDIFTRFFQAVPETMLVKTKVGTGPQFIIVQGQEKAFFKALYTIVFGLQESVVEAATINPWKDDTTSLAIPYPECSKGNSASAVTVQQLLCSGFKYGSFLIVDPEEGNWRHTGNTGNILTTLQTFFPYEFDVDRFERNAHREDLLHYVVSAMLLTDAKEEKILVADKTARKAEVAEASLALSIGLNVGVGAGSVCVPSNVFTASAAWTAKYTRNAPPTFTHEYAITVTIGDGINLMLTRTSGGKTTVGLKFSYDSVATFTGPEVAELATLTAAVATVKTAITAAQATPDSGTKKQRLKAFFNALHMSESYVAFHNSLLAMTAVGAIDGTLGAALTSAMGSLAEAAIPSLGLEASHKVAVEMGFEFTGSTLSDTKAKLSVTDKVAGSGALGSLVFANGMTFTIPVA